MKTLSRFITEFTSLIVSALSRFGRVIFKGYLPTVDGLALERFVDHLLKIRRSDFVVCAEKQSDVVVAHAEQLAQQVRAEYRFLLGISPRGQAGRRDPSRTTDFRGFDLCSLPHGMLPQLPPCLRQGSPAPGQQTTAITRLVLLRSRSQLGLDLHPPDDLVSVHRPSLRQWTPLAGSADAQVMAWVQYPRQCLYGTR